MTNDYLPIADDMSYQEWRTIVDVREDEIGSGVTLISFKEKLLNPEGQIIAFYSELSRRGDKNLLREYIIFFNLKIERK